MANDPPAYIFNTTSEKVTQLLPDKSQHRYVKEYEKFMKWYETQKANSLTEELLLSYFGDMAKVFAPTTLIATYSMLKSMISTKHNVNIGSYSQLLTFLKKSRKGFVSSTLPRIFSADEVNKFLMEAPDSEYLPIKVVTVFAICVSPQSDVLTNIKMEYITDYGTEIVVRVPDATTKGMKVCVISGKMVDIVRNYIRLRPETIPTDRLFIQYRDGRCTIQHIGKHTIAKMPKKIAKFLGWPESEILNGLSFRRMSSGIVSSAKKKTSTAFEASHQTFEPATATVIMGRIEAAPENAYTKNATNTQQTVPIPPNSFSNVSIKQEDDQIFEAGEYILGDPIHFSHQAIVVKVENEPVHENAYSRSEDNENVNQDDRNTTTINRLTPEQRLHQPGLYDTVPSETNPNKRIKCSGAVAVATNGLASCQNNSHCQQTIKTQAEEIARLKQLIERQNSKIDSLEALLLDNLRKKFETSEQTMDITN